ncbi:FAD-dependent oxidoreductase [Litoribrevibacter albus]|uniref:Nitrite reductase n=1 Tax=Litoribrevibacter albus TaxID=1473156 RepID=A0AA37W862_9GAMM|nr:FAD-dependent oxidoreductase [Litoribrevibacter albus]GLQ33415.1 nitrite reductase [Litoribrevibacter albus]
MTSSSISLKDVDVFDASDVDALASTEVQPVDALASQFTQRVVVIGSGPVGMRFVKELLKRHPLANIQLFGNEPFQPYNRVQLSALLAGEVSRDDIDLSLPTADTHPNFEYIIATVKAVDTEQKTLVDANGTSHSYDRLVFATGARAHVPNIPGVEQSGVYTFRNLKDTEFLYARVASARHVVVVGGGLLGLEAARALSRLNTKVTLVQQASRLMNRQLDDRAAEMLQDQVEALGIRVITCSGVRAIHSAQYGVPGRSSVIGVTTYYGEDIECDTVVLCAGIKPNIELAREAKLKVANGIVVNDDLQTSDSSVYAIGECCEHQGATYGLVNPGLEQAAVAADVIAGGFSKYLGSLTVSRLKVVGQKVYSMGDVTELVRRPFQTVVCYEDSRLGIYRKFVFFKGKLIGALAFGDWPELNRVQEAFKQGRTVYPWQLITFRLTGRLWVNEQAEEIIKWPFETVVCQCNNVTQGELTHQLASGCQSVADLSMETGAGSVCGSCKPLLGQLVEQYSGDTAEREKESGWLPVLFGSVMAVLLALMMVFQPESQVANSVQQQTWFEHIWNDGFWKQVTGFSLLGLTFIGLIMSLRKRFGWHWMGQFSHWRTLHTVLGMVCVALLIFHTGFHLGANLNLLLMVNFLAVIALGSMAGGVVALSHALPSSIAMTFRKLWTWLHILVTWPLPALLSIHILSVYYF